MRLERGKSLRAAITLASLFTLGLILSGCDSCGDFAMRGGDTPLACKSDGPQPR